MGLPRLVSIMFKLAVRYPKTFWTTPYLPKSKGIFGGLAAVNLWAGYPAITIPFSATNNTRNDIKL